MARKPAGFTLVEVAVSVSILAIFLAVGLPAMAAFLERQRAAAATASLVSHMSHARLAAVKHRHPTVLCPSIDGQECVSGGDWSSGWILFVDREGKRRPASLDDVLQVELTPRSRHLGLRGSSGRNHLRYLPDGRSAGSNLTIRVCSRKGMQLAAVVVNNAGRPRTERTADGIPCPA